FAVRARSSRSDLLTKLLCGFRSDGFYGREGGKQVLGEDVTFLQVLRTVVGNPDFALTVFAHENFERNIKASTGCIQHHWRSRIGTAKDEQLCRPHVEAGFRGLSAVINEREQRYFFGLQDSLDLVDCLFDGMIAGFVDDSVVFYESHGFLPNVCSLS